MVLPDGIVKTNIKKITEVIMRENPIDVAACGTCSGKLFTQEQVHMVSLDAGSGRYISALNTVMWRCSGCNAWLKETISAAKSQPNAIKRSISSEIGDDIINPSSTRIDLNEITGQTKSLLRRPGGLSNLGAGLAGPNNS